MKNSVRCIFLSALLLALFTLASCRADSTEASTLWVVTEKSNSDGMNLQAQMVAQRMEAEHPGLAVQLDILPTEEESRELALQQLRTQILAGRGPDVYLLPTGNVLTVDDPVRGTKISIEPLFSDVNQSMRQGVFLDIEGYYSTDIALDQGALKAEVMDAGVWAGGRYVLPLRFDIPVIYVSKEYYSSLIKVLADTTSLVEAILAREDAGMAAYGLLLPENLELLPLEIDYKTGDMTMTASDIAAYMKVYQAWTAVRTPARLAHEAIWNEKLEESYADLPGFLDLLGYQMNYDAFNDIFYFLLIDGYWKNASFPIYTSRLNYILDTLAIAEVEADPVEMVPLRGMDGSIVATVTYFGAVGSSCTDPELAYAFLRQFLTEEFQWDGYRPRVDKTVSIWDVRKDPQVPRMVENSWPVRATGSVSPLWETVRYQEYLGVGNNYHREDSTALLQRFRSPSLLFTDEDLPALAWPIDRVSFPITLEEEMSLSHALAQLNEEDGSPTEADIDALASDVWHGLQWHLAEG